MDDEYFFIIVASILEGNERQGQQFDTKVLRALRRRPAFARTAFSTARPATVEGQSVVSFTVDRTRIERVVEKTARGIYHHHTRGQKLLGTLRVILPMLRNPDGSLLAGVAELGQGLQAVQIPWLGDNPEVFCYRIHIHPTNGGSFVQMSFYEGFAAFVAWGGRFAERSAG